MNRRQLPVGIQDFRKIRQNNMMYVDKTPYVWTLAQTSCPYFLSRPRRFGKSLFTSTLDYQTGYLTICGYDREFELYSLKFPNDEVRYGFLNSLVPYVLGSRNAENPTSLRYMFMDLKKGKPDSFNRP